MHFSCTRSSVVDVMWEHGGQAQIGERSQSRLSSEVMLKSLGTHETRFSF